VRISAVLVRRSTLILPVNVPRFVETAHLRGADAVTLDLEDAVPAPEKAAARRLVREAIPRFSRGGGEVLVRVNHDPAHLRKDLDVSVCAELDGICFPKTESAGEVERLDAQVADLERSRGISPGRIELALLIETPRGLLSLETIAGASRRIRTISLGPEDYCLELGVEPSADGAMVDTSVYVARSVSWNRLRPSPRWRSERPPPWHARPAGVLRAGAVGDQQGSHHRPDLGLRPDRPLRCEAGLRHAGRGHERLHPHERPPGRPHEPSLALADMVAGFHLALGVMMALRGQKRGERGGQELDLSLYELLFNFMAADFLTYSLSGVAAEIAALKSYGAI